MKSLKESLFDKDLVSKDIFYHPKTKDELIDLLVRLIEERGSDANLNDIDVSKITDMQCMFCDCHNFNSDLSKWNVGNVKDMKDMFYRCYNFNSDLSKWNVKNVRNKYNIFYGCGIPDKYKPKFKII